jgi:hypothetical protein
MWVSSTNLNVIGQILVALTPRHRRKSINPKHRATIQSRPDESVLSVGERCSRSAPSGNVPAATRSVKRAVKGAAVKRFYCATTGTVDFVEVVGSDLENSR